MIWQSPRLWIYGLMAMVFTAGPTTAGDSERKDDARMMVKDAALFIIDVGEAKAYAEISRKSGRFHDRDLYITVVRRDGKVLAHGQRADFVGQNLINAKDPDGKLFIKERRDLSLKNLSFWQRYKFMNPSTRKIEVKDTYCEIFNETNICGGVYGS